MNRFLIALAALLMAAPAFSQNITNIKYRDAKELAYMKNIYSRFSKWIPDGWYLDAVAEGDLDGDGIPDAALVVTDVDIYHLEDISKPLESKFLVLLNQGNRYRVFIDDDQATARGYGATGLVEVFVEINKQVLRLHKGPGYLAWGGSDLYRMENGRFRLIGSDFFHRSFTPDGETIIESTSSNYLTGKCNIEKEIITKENTKPVVVWKKLKNNRKVYFGESTEGIEC